MAESVKGARLAPFVKQGVFDAAMQFKDAGLIAASAAATVGGSAKVVDLGTGLFQGCMILNVSALEIATGDEAYTIVVQLSSDADFGTAGHIVEACALHLGAKGTKLTDSDRDDTAGRYKLYFDNENDAALYRYARVYTVVAGTIATGINYTAHAVPME